MKYDFTTLSNRSRSGAEKYINMRRKNPDVADNIVPFSVSDMEFLPPPELINGLRDFIGSTIFGYTLPPESYYTTMLDWMYRRHGLEIKRDWLVDVDNVIMALRQMICAFTAPESGVVILTPVYPAFAESVRATRRTLYECPLMLGNHNYCIDFDRLEHLCCRKDVSMLVICNPHNPVGCVWSKDELEMVADICLSNHVFIVSDEIHWDLILPGTSFTSMASLNRMYTDNCAVSTASTKTFNTAAFKGATVIITDELRRKQFIDYNNVSGRDLLSFKVCEWGYSLCEEWLEELLCVLDSNRKLMEDFMHDRLPEVGVIQLKATYLQWLDFRFLGLNAQSLENFMVYNAKCYFTEGWKFGAGGAGFERWNIACPQNVLLAGLERIEKAVREFKR